MACSLDDPKVSKALEIYKNLMRDSQQCVSELKSCSALEEIYTQKMDETFEHIEGLLQQASDSIATIEEEIVEKDTTLYFDRNYFTNMGWLLVADILDRMGSLEEEYLFDYLLFRTKEDERIQDGLNRLIFQGLISRGLITKYDYTQGHGYGEIRKNVPTYYLTEKGNELYRNGKFIYHPYTQQAYLRKEGTADIVSFEEKRRGGQQQ